MAEIGDYFDGTDELDSFFTLIEPGIYEAMITESHMRENRFGSGQYLELHFMILNGPYAQRTVIHRLNLVHTNEVVQRIARAELKAICQALSVQKVDDSEQLHERPLKIKIVVTKRRDTGEDVNAIRGFMPIAPISKPAGGGLPPQLAKFVAKPTPAEASEAVEEPVEPPNGDETKKRGPKKRWTI